MIPKGKYRMTFAKMDGSGKKTETVDMTGERKPKLNPEWIRIGEVGGYAEMNRDGSFGPWVPNKPNKVLEP